MGRRNEASNLLRQGISPRKIADKMGVSLDTVMQYLHHQIGEGAIRRSDVVFSISRSTRNLVEALIAELGTEDPYKISKAARESGHPPNEQDLYIYCQFRDARVALGDMYEMIRDIELTIHDGVKSMLEFQFGEEWWRDGIPEQIRVECSTALEKDPEPVEEPYCYTTFIHLREIIGKRWEVFSKLFPKRVRSSKDGLLDGLARLNRIRNIVMHPVRGTKLTEDDFAFVRKFREDMELERWRDYGPQLLAQQILGDMDTEGQG